MDLREAILQAEKLWIDGTIQAIKNKIASIQLINSGDLERSIGYETDDSVDISVRFKMADYGKYQDRGVNPEGLALYQTPFYFKGQWKGMAYYLKDWARARNLNEYAVAYTLQNYTGIKPKLFFNSVIETRMNQLGIDIGDAMIKATDENIKKYNSQQ